MGCAGLPSSFFATPFRTTPGCPPRITSTSASMIRTVTPHPLRQSGQTPGFHSATPGTSSSSGTKRMSCCSGFPQLASVALVPVMAVSLMKERRSISGGLSEVARRALVRRVLLAVTGHAESHVQVNVALGHGLVRDVAVTRRALDARADVRGVVEPHVRLRRITVHALPLKIEAFLLHRGDLLDERPIRGEHGVADHAGVDARQPGDGTLRHALVTGSGAETGSAARRGASPRRSRCPRRQTCCEPA